MKQEPGSPQQRAVKQEPQDIGQFLLPEHGHVLECLGTYIDPQCFPGADFELDVSTAWALALRFHRVQQRPTLPVLLLRRLL